MGPTVRAIEDTKALEGKRKSRPAVGIGTADMHEPKLFFLFYSVPPTDPKLLYQWSVREKPKGTIITNLGKNWKQVKTLLEYGKQIFN